MSTDKTNIIVEITCDSPDLRADIDRLKELAGDICRRFCVERAMISIAIVDDKKIKEVNAEFLNSQNRTDVISFDLSDETDDAKSFELIINAEEAQRQAQKRGHSTEAELALYITHGLLHNLGFDDAEADEAEKMHNVEDEILQQAGFGIIYGK
jgi:probable rRNA maturation factor